MGANQSAEHANLMRRYESQGFLSAEQANPRAELPNPMRGHVYQPGFAELADPRAELANLMRGRESRGFLSAELANPRSELANLLGGYDSLGFVPVSAELANLMGNH